MYDLVIRRAKAADNTLFDIAIRHGKIALVGSVPADAPTQQQQDLAGKYWLSAGWIDSHVHCYSASPIYHDEPDAVGVAGGVTTVIDAGSTGCDDVGELYRLTRDAKTQVYALLNIARTGIRTQNELADLTQIDKQGARQAIKDNPGFIIGFKARISSSVVGENGVRPLILAKEIQRENQHMPLMVHIGNNPPNLDEIAELLEPGDIITHCFNGKPNRILTPEGTLRQSIAEALQRGVLLDVGHGAASFSFAVAEQAIKLGIYPDTISSDIYCRNRLSGPVYSLALVMSKFFQIGLSLEQILTCVTRNAAAALHLQHKGQLQVGYDADLTIFDVVNQPLVFNDSEGLSVQGDKYLVPLAAVVAGKVVLTEQGEAADVFDL